LDPSATRSQGRCPSIRTLMEIEAFLALPNSGSPIQGMNPSSL